MFVKSGKQGINSSKVYCKFYIIRIHICQFIVLIVAKCIVNLRNYADKLIDSKVLIVAKCIVN